MKKSELVQIIRNELKNLSERVASPMSYKLRDAQDAIEYMIEQGPLEDEDVYSKPGDAMKHLSIAQKALSKIK
jgi:predicted DNA-binding protein